MSRSSLSSRLPSRLARLVMLAGTATTLAACGGGDGPTGPGAAPTQALLVVRNASTVALTAVQFSACSETTWGGNRLDANESIAPGQSRSWQVTPGCYDVRAQTSSGASATFFDRTVDAGQTRELTVNNPSNAVMTAGAGWKAR